MLNNKQFMGQPLKPYAINPNSIHSVPKKGFMGKPSSPAEATAKAKMANGVFDNTPDRKREARKMGLSNYIDRNTQIYGSSSKMRRAKAVLAGKPPVNQRKPK